MTDAKFFSQAWCDKAIQAVNANEAMRAGFKDPDAFTNKMAFVCTDRPDCAVHLEWDKGRVVSWTTPKFDESELWLVINGTQETWRTAASGAEEGGKLLMGGKIKIAKGPMSAAIENAGAFNSFLATWGEVATDWDV